MEQQALLIMELPLSLLFCLMELWNFILILEFLYKMFNMLYHLLTQLRSPQSQEQAFKIYNK